MADAAPPRWAAAATLPAAVAALGVSAYLAWAHYVEPTALSCPDTGVVNCTKVTTSPQSMVLGVPVAVIGVMFFVAMSALCTPVAWRSRRREVALGRLAGAVTGVATVCYLVAVEALVVHAICLWCTAVHVLAFGLFVGVLAAHLHVPVEQPGHHPARLRTPVAR